MRSLRRAGSVDLLALEFVVALQVGLEWEKTPMPQWISR